MKFGVVVFPGSNCDQDIIHVLRDVMQQEVEVLWHKEEQLPDFTTEDCIVLPGGFSYGDYLRSGAIARFSPIMPEVIRFAKKGGKVWGICNGFQILCEAGLLPGALLRNADQQFICKNTYIQPGNTSHLLTRGLDPNQPLKIPVAHAEGRYYADEATIDRLVENDQVLFYYCNERGNASNVNGSARHIAGICNETGNVMGMMPHPERAAEEELGNTDGRKLFESLLQEELVAR
jgi:phosphoribosylformylglycinamidine synthase